MTEVNVVPVNVVVVFYSRYGDTERLALAAGVGAVQARANIRLRRLKDLADAETIGRDPRWTENLKRMTPDYIAPREVDADWADVILVVSCPDSPRETEQYVEALAANPAKKEALRIVSIADDSATAWRHARRAAKPSRWRGYASSDHPLATRAVLAQDLLTCDPTSRPLIQEAEGKRSRAYSSASALALRGRTEHLAAER